MKKYFIAGIGTDVGKTLASAVIVEKLYADYWKPIQTGNQNPDSPIIRSLISNPYSIIHNEACSFYEPKSPHIAANSEGKTIELDSLELPTSENKNLIIEGAGGILVPLNKKNFVIELAEKFDAEVVLVIRNYLGCINHSLLSLNYLCRNNFKIKGIILNGNFEEGVVSVIKNHFNFPVLLEIGNLQDVSHFEISKLALRLHW